MTLPDVGSLTSRPAFSFNHRPSIVGPVPDVPSTVRQQTTCRQSPTAEWAIRSVPSTRDRIHGERPMRTTAALQASHEARGARAGGHLSRAPDNRRRGECRPLERTTSAGPAWPAPGRGPGSKPVRRATMRSDTPPENLLTSDQPPHQWSSSKSPSLEPPPLAMPPPGPPGPSSSSSSEPPPPAPPPEVPPLPEPSSESSSPPEPLPPEPLPPEPLPPVPPLPDPLPPVPPLPVDPLLPVPPEPALPEPPPPVPSLPVEPLLPVPPEPLLPELPLPLPLVPPELPVDPESPVPLLVPPPGGVAGPLRLPEPETWPGRFRR